MLYGLRIVLSSGVLERIWEYTAHNIHNNIYKEMRILEKNMYFKSIRWVNVDYTVCIQ